MPPDRAPSGSAAERTRGRAPWGTISRDQVVDAAVRALRRPGGYESMTIRSLAADLGVAPMSLYRHVRDKDDLLEEAVDRLLARAWRPRTPTSDWKAWMAEAADKLRHFLVTQPAALRVFLRHPVVSPSAVARMEAALVVLRDATGDEESARRAYGAIQSYTVGFAALEASRAGWESTHGRQERSDGGTPVSRRTSKAKASGLAEELATYTTPRQFAEGLRFLLAGIELDITKTS